MILLLVRNTERSYVAVIYQDKILLTRNWLSNRPIWRLPGGGNHPGENSVNAASRELTEETGISIQANQLKPLALSKKHQKKFTYNIYFTVLDYQPDISNKTLEIIDAQFIEFKLIGDTYKTDEQVESAIKALKALEIV